MKVDIYNTNKKYNIIYADPPWTFKTYSDKGKGKSAEQHYCCMKKEDIQNLPVLIFAKKIVYCFYGLQHLACKKV